MAPACDIWSIKDFKTLGSVTKYLPLIQQEGLTKSMNNYRGARGVERGSTQGFEKEEGQQGEFCNSIRDTVSIAQKRQ